MITYLHNFASLNALFYMTYKRFPQILNKGPIKYHVTPQSSGVLPIAHQSNWRHMKERRLMILANKMAIFIS